MTVVTAPYDKSDLKANGLISRQFIDGIELVVIDSGDSNRLPFLRRAFRSILFSLFSSWYAVFEKKDVIVASSGPITIGLPALVGKLFTRKPLVFEVRDLWPDGAIEMGILKNPIAIRLAKWFEKQCYLKADYVVPCSSGMEDSINKRFPLVKTLTIPNACDVNLFSGKNKKPEEEIDTKYFIYAGSLGVMDSVEEIIEACKYLNNRDDFLIYIIGAGVEREKLESLTKAYNLEEKVKFLGLVPKEEVVAWFRNAYASFVLFKSFPVLSTSSPNKMFDSFAAGVPIIQNTEGWIKELVSDSNCGINVKSNDAQAMSKAMEYLLENEDKRDEMAAKAFELAINNFHRDKLANDYLEMLKGLK